MARGKINYALAVPLLQGNATLAEVAPQVGAKNADVLRVGLARKGVPVRWIRSLPFHPDRIESEANNVLLQVSRLVREKLSAEINESVDVLGKIPKAQTLKHLKERVEILEPLARTAKVVHGWDNDGHSSPVTPGDMDNVEIEVLPQTPLVDCGVPSEKQTSQ
jgi:hypothetical protein